MKSTEANQAIHQAREIIASALSNANMTRSELARRIGTSRAYVTQILKSQRNFTIETLANILFVTGHDLKMSKTRRKDHPMSEPTKPMSIEEQINKTIKLATDYLGNSTALELLRRWSLPSSTLIHEAVVTELRDTLLSAKSTIDAAKPRSRPELEKAIWEAMPAGCIYGHTDAQRNNNRNKIVRNILPLIPAATVSQDAVELAKTIIDVMPRLAADHSSGSDDCSLCKAYHSLQALRPVCDRILSAAVAKEPAARYFLCKCGQTMTKARADKPDVVATLTSKKCEKCGGDQTERDADSLILELHTLLTLSAPDGWIEDTGYLEDLARDGKMPGTVPTLHHFSVVSLTKKIPTAPTQEEVEAAIGFIRNCSWNYTGHSTWNSDTAISTLARAARTQSAVASEDTREKMIEELRLAIGELTERHQNMTTTAKALQQELDATKAEADKTIAELRERLAGMEKDRAAYNEFMQYEKHPTRLMVESGDYPQAYEVWFNALDEVLHDVCGRSFGDICDGMEEIPSPADSIRSMFTMLSNALYDAGLKDHVFTKDGLEKIAKRLLDAEAAIAKLKDNEVITQPPTCREFSDAIGEDKANAIGIPNSTGELITSWMQREAAARYAATPAYVPKPCPLCEKELTCVDMGLLVCRNEDCELTGAYTHAAINKLTGASK